MQFVIPLNSISVPPNRLRQLRPQVVSDIAESIRNIGLINPISLQRNGQRYTLVAGRHRLEAARALSHPTIPAIVLDCTSADQVALAELDENLIRADLSAAERALHLHRRKTLYEKLHPGTKHGGDRRSVSSSKLENLKSFTADTAAKTNRARSGISRDIARAANIVDLEEAIGTSLDTGEQLDALAKLPAESQTQLIARAKGGEKVDAKVAVSRERRRYRERELAEATKAAAVALGKKLYGVIYADPPWRLDQPGIGTPDRATENHYPTMSVEEIKALPVPGADDCCLFLWAPIPQLEYALSVMSAWGFAYKSAITWVKDKIGTGYWVRGQAELLLIAVRGNVPAPAAGEQPPAIIEAPRSRHSEKPDIFATEIARLFPNVPKLEMFAREPRDGWDVWGNEV